MSYGCDFIFLAHFTWFAQTSTTQQIRNKFHTKTQKEQKHADTRNKDIMIHTRMLKMTITVNERSHFIKKGNSAD